MNDLSKTVKSTILRRKLISPGDYVLLGLSGGADSLCLLHILLELQDEMDFDLCAVHINHGIRGKAADDDAAWVVEHCRKSGVSCVMVQANVPLYAQKLHLTEEEAGRHVRREVFAFMAYGLLGDNVSPTHPAYKLRSMYVAPNGAPGKPRAVKIALAHNMQDQAETILMRILRGTGVHGLTGIQYQSSVDDALEHLARSIHRHQAALDANAKGPKANFDSIPPLPPHVIAEREKMLKALDISIIRPLLDTSREEIESYCTENQLQPRVDHTNAEADYTRNKVRLELIPYLEKDFNPNIKQTLVRLAANAAEDDEALASAAEQVLHDAEKVIMPAAFLSASADAQGEGSKLSGRSALFSRQTEIGSISLDAKKLRRQPPAVFKRVIVSEFEKLGLTEGISAVHLNALWNAVQKNIGGKTIEFPGGFTAELRAGTLTLK